MLFSNLIYKQLSASVFGIYLIFVIVLVNYYNIHTSTLYRNDIIFIFALFFQIAIFIFKLESRFESLLIIIFHILSMIMEIYKVHIGSWKYFGNGVFSIYSVPLFTGFMYSAVGNYIVRSIRLYSVKFTKIPKSRLLFLLIFLIYLNFFTNHYIYDFRYIILLLIAYTYFNFSILIANIKIDILFFFTTVTLLVWIAENILTYVRVWIYPNQIYYWELVSFSKFISWFLLVVMSFSLILLFKKIFKFI